jgi:hypothetical protein
MLKNQVLVFGKCKAMLDFSNFLLEQIIADDDRCYVDASSVSYGQF